MFHMLASDCERFLDFLQRRDPIFVVARDSDRADILRVVEPCAFEGALCLWNQSLLPRLRRDYIPESIHGPYYRISDSLPVLEFLSCRETRWNGCPALVQGRVWGSFDDPSERFRKWFEAIVRWIRRNYVRDPAGPLGGYVGPAALKWYKEGGILLPMFEPPVTNEWLSFVKAQHPPLH